MMGQLLETRVKPSPPLPVTGIDFAGPFTTKRGNPRKPTHLKSYVCLFVCIATKCIHLKLCSDLSMASLMAALTRFVGMRGLPCTIYTNNKTKFVGVSCERFECYELLNSKDFQKKMSHLSSNKRIRWHFSPARAPHFGGLWEAGVKSMKSILIKTLPPHLLNYEEFSTILTDVEAVLKSRPLLSLDTTPSDGSIVLPPGHFLIGRPLKSLLIYVDEDINPSLLKRLKLVQYLSTTSRRCKIPPTSRHYSPGRSGRTPSQTSR